MILEYCYYILTDAPSSNAAPYIFLIGFGPPRG
jgi:hypothetical protein